MHKHAPSDKMSEKTIARVETLISAGADPETIADILKKDGITGYNAWLIYKAAEVSLAMFERTSK